MIEPTELRFVSRFTLTAAVRPWSFRYSLWKPSHFDSGLEVHSVTTTWRSMRLDDVRCGLRMSSVGEDGLQVSVYADERWSGDMRPTLIDRLRWSYGLDDDIRPFLSMARRNPALRLATTRLRGMRLSCPESIFEIAILSLLLQNTTIARTTQMMRNLLSHHGSIVKFDRVTLPIFFSPSEIAGVTESSLREHDRLGYRAKYLPRFARFFGAEQNCEIARTVDLTERLLDVKGVGPYTAGIIASHAQRSTHAVGLDVWNTRLIGRAVLSTEDASQGEVRSWLDEHFPGYAGLAALYLVEAAYLDSPVVPLVAEGAVDNGLKRKPAR